MLNHQAILNIKELIIKAGTIALEIRQQGLEIYSKHDHSPVTNADHEISILIFEQLSTLFPHISIICEERPPITVRTNQTFWLIDPIDGTKSYIQNHDSFTINIALIEKQIATYGFVYQPSKNTLYFTDEKKQSVVEINGEQCPIHTKHDGLVCIVSSNHRNQQTQNFIQSNKFARIIEIPSSIKLCMIATGEADIYPKFSPTMEWDIAAGHALINASGGSIITSDNKSLSYAKDRFYNPNFIATSNKIQNASDLFRDFIDQ